jgi:hypothetical protein
MHFTVRYKSLEADEKFVPYIGRQIFKVDWEAIKKHFILDSQFWHNSDEI